MTLTAQLVLADCRHVLDLLEKESQPQTFRVLWVAGVALARAVGHVLQKVDARQGDVVKKAVQVAYDSWRVDRLGNAIFWEFIEQERNQVLKQYEMGFLPGPIEVGAGSDAFTLDEHMFCPIADGAFAGADCRDVLAQAIEWWSLQLSEIESIARD